jgi:hypothetical protein
MEKVSKLVDLVEQLREFEEVIKPGMRYKDSKGIRELCQEIKSVAQDLRVEVNEFRKQ